MCNKGFFKKVVPFFLTFAVGLFIASFFVTVAAPSFRFGSGFRRHQEYHRKMEAENQRLREENFRLKQNSFDRGTALSSPDLTSDSLTVPPPPMLPIPPPAPSRIYRR